MTAQQPDILIHNGRRYDLCSLPLEQLYERFIDPKPRPPFAATSNACYRGYIATWEFISGRLCLVAIDGLIWRGDDRESAVPIDLAKLFPSAGQPIFADWVRDELRCPEGRLLSYAHHNFLSVYERDRIFRVSGGVLEVELLRLNPPPPVHYRINPDGTRDLLDDPYEETTLPDPIPSDIMPEGHLFWGRPPPAERHEGYLVAAEAHVPPPPPSPIDGP